MKDTKTYGESIEELHEAWLAFAEAIMEKLKPVLIWLTKIVQGLNQFLSKRGG